MKKILIALALCLALVGVMAVPAMAAKPNNSGSPHTTSIQEAVDANIISADGFQLQVDCFPAETSTPQLSLFAAFIDPSGNHLNGISTEVPLSDLVINIARGTATLNTSPDDGHINLTWSFNRRDVVNSVGVTTNSPGVMAEQYHDSNVSTGNGSPMTLTGSIFGKKSFDNGNIDLSTGVDLLTSDNFGDVDMTSYSWVSSK